MFRLPFYYAFGALQINLGKQWVFGKKFLIDAYWGFGYGFDNKKSSLEIFYDDNVSANNYVNSRIGKSPGLAISFAMKLGWLIN